MRQTVFDQREGRDGALNPLAFNTVFLKKNICLCVTDAMRGSLYDTDSCVVARREVGICAVFVLLAVTAILGAGRAPKLVS